MSAPLKPGAELAQLNGPVIETPRLKLRQRRSADIEPCTAMLADPARFITVDSKPVENAMTGWRHGCDGRAPGDSWCGHVRGRGKSHRQICRTPWVHGFRRPDFEIGWGIAKEAQGKGYATEAARAAIDRAFATFEIAQVIHCIDRENTASQGVARRLGAEKQREIELFGHVADIWVTTRDAWTRPQN
jgi:RimJ/RimL family protein N-acetyltransferase